MKRGKECPVRRVNKRERDAFDEPIELRSSWRNGCGDRLSFAPAAASSGYVVTPPTREASSLQKECELADGSLKLLIDSVDYQLHTATDEAKRKCFGP